MIAKLPFVQVVLAVERLYDQSLPEAQVSDRCATIGALIEACGWTEDEYWSEWLSQECTLDNAPDKPYVSQERILS
jgi:hypothetical protein